jgi:hypothetical protein
MTTWFSLSVQITLAIFSIVPLIILLVYAVVLSPLKEKTITTIDYPTSKKGSTLTLLYNIAIDIHSLINNEGTEGENERMN